MYDRQVRRRRAVLAVFVALSLILLTAYFGESAGGGLHAVQRGALQVLGPIQEGASRALKPARDLFGWVGDTLDAKEQRDELLKRAQSLEREVTDLQAAEQENQQLRKMLEINTAGGLERYQPVKARVSARSPSLFYSQITVDKGSSAGVRVDQPVVNGDGLVGRVSAVTPGYSIVTLITDDQFAAAARTLGSNQQATISASVNRPGGLELEFVQAPRVRRGERVVTAGSLSPRLKSYFPPNIPIGRVSRVDIGDGDLDRRIHVKPAADLGSLLWVEILTRDVEPQLEASTDPTGTPTP
ncbi:MAG TPA: rod shape-determining protein MreC [Solirubrobacteraceae bacterium]|nr:rod shape-determining protein MreC [Solirubrobacteraceae bacterium]